MITDAQKRATIKYDKANIRRYVVKLNKKYDADLINYLDQLENVKGKVKEVMTNDMNANGIIVYLRDVGTDKYEVKFNSKKFRTIYNELKDVEEDDDLDLYFINRSDLVEELNKIIEYVGTNQINICYTK